jgi:hypothetical protein
MTDANPPATGHPLDAQSADFTPAVPEGTSGIGASTGEETRSAAGSGGAGARQRPPGAASPAGWFPSPAGEAAPPVRNREPARSGETAQDAEPDPRPTSWYRIPGTLSPGARRLLVSSPAEARPAPEEGQASPGPADGKQSPGVSAGGPAPQWPLITQRGPRNIPVVGPTEALRAVAGGQAPGDPTPSSAVPAQGGATQQNAVPTQVSVRPRSAVPAPVSATQRNAVPAQVSATQPNAVPNQVSATPSSAVPAQVSARGSGWQLAQRAWQDSGRDWETAAGRPPVPGPRQPDAYVRAPYGADPYAHDPYAAAAYGGPGPYAPGANRADRYRPAPYGAAHASGSYAAAPYAPDVFAPDPYAVDQYSGEYPVGEYQEGEYREDEYAGQHGSGAFAAAPHAPDAYTAGRNGAGADDAEPYSPDSEPYRRGSLPPRRDRADSDTTRVDFGIPHRPRAAAPWRYPDDPPAPSFHPADPPAADPGWGGEPPDVRYAAAPVLEDSRSGVGPWPVQPFPEDPRADRAAEDLADRETATPDDDAGQEPDGYQAAGPGGDSGDRRPETRAGRAAHRWPGAAAPGGDGRVPPTLRYARQPPPLPRQTPQPPPLPRRTPPHSQDWSGEAAGYLPGQPVADDRGVQPTPDDHGDQVRLPSEPDAAPPGAARFTGSAALSESDELFRAWQGSVRDAAGPRVRRPAGQSARRRRAWQAAKIGVPAVVIVTVGAGALLMLTGRANQMLAERSSTGTARTGQATSSTASMILAGYPGMRGGVRVAAMWPASGTIVAVGMADGHPAIWRRALNGGWPLVSAGDLGTMSGHLTSVAHGAAGWIAVGSVTANGVAQPMVYTSPDGVTWRTVPSLTAMVRSDAQFLGVAAGHGGYLVVGREGTGKQKFAQLWWSRDLANWTAGGNSGYHNSIAIAAVADGDGFVAAGSQADCHTIWTSPDGTHWKTHDVTRPAGARTATLRYAAAGTGGRVVTAGFATNDAGGVPIVVTTDPAGAHIVQVVLPTGGVPGVVTGVTASGGGFVAAGMIGPAKAQRAVTWTSADGLTWTAATPVSPAAGTAITALATAGGHVTGTLQRGMDPAVLTLPAP